MLNVLAALRVTPKSGHDNGAQILNMMIKL
jgi:hypothetical protein